jgi:hypothetical protein
MSKPTVVIYLSPNGKSTKVLADHLATVIDDLNKIIMIHFVYISKANADKVKAKGIKKSPTLIYGNRKFEGLENIIKVLTPPKRERETYGYGITNPDEMLHKWQSDVIDTYAEDEDEEDIGGEMGRRKLQERMEAFQKRRPKMDGVSKKHQIPGGRNVKSRNTQKDYNPERGDDDFIRDSGINNIVQTPTDTYVQDTDGELILEDYYLDEAIMAGKKQSAGRIHRGHNF